MSPIPATTGQLRTRIQDMEIGDYIMCYISDSVTPWDFKYLGNTNMTELPITGVSGGGGAFYFIKTAKGLLISDRVVYHSKSWDSINSMKLIQGLPFDAGNIIPTMTSNTSPSGVASASSEYSTSFPAYLAFDKNTAEANRWTSKDSDTENWLGYDFMSPKTIRAYAITSYNYTGRGFDPKSWTFEGWNGSQWVTLDTQINQTFTQTQRKVFLLNKACTFNKFRLYITAINGQTRVIIGELEMMETAGIIRSLTGGVAYVDAQGNKLTTAPSPQVSAWPTNSEWDKHIKGFDPSKIQSGKTLDDVFHWNGIETWCQDTPMISIGTASERVRRGRFSAESFRWVASSTSDAYTGFRPVFQFQE